MLFLFRDLKNVLQMCYFMLQMNCAFFNTLHYFSFFHLKYTVIQYIYTSYTII